MRPKGCGPDRDAQHPSVAIPLRLSIPLATPACPALFSLESVQLFVWMLVQS